MNLKKTLVGACAAASVLTILVGSPASAEGISASFPATLQGAGSDTTQDVMNAMAASINTSLGVPALSNWDSTPVGSTISVESSAGCTNVTRPNGSGQGVQALDASIRGLPLFGSTSLQDCFEYARASGLSNPSGATAGSMTAFALAHDTAGYVRRSNGSVPRAIPLGFDATSGAACTSTSALSLARLYKFDCNPGAAPGSAACLGLRPLIVQAGSGSLGFFASALGISSATTFGAAGGWSNCVDPNNRPQENDGTALPNNPTGLTQLIAYSLAQYRAQAKGLITDLRGATVFGAICRQPLPAGTTCAQNAFTPDQGANYEPRLQRNVYNVVRTDRLNATVTGSTTVADIFGPGGLICQRSNIISLYGFDPLPAGPLGTTCGQSAANPWTGSNPI